MKKIWVLMVSLVMIFGLCLPTWAKEDKTPEEEAAIKIMKRLDRYAGKDMEKMESLFYKTDKETIQEYYDQDWSFVRAEHVASHVIAKSGKTSVVNLIYYEPLGDASVDYLPITVMMVKRGDKYLIDHRDSTIRRLNKEVEKKGYYPEDYTKAINAGRNGLSLDENNYMYADKSCIFEDCIYTEPRFMWQKENGDVEVLVWINNGLNEDFHFVKAEIACMDEQLGEFIHETIDVDMSAKKKTSSIHAMTIPADKVKSGTELWSYVDAEIALESGQATVNS